eukprot:scaffold226800_cov37-Attheya_sp.AAC.1
MVDKRKQEAATDVATVKRRTNLSTSSFLELANDDSPSFFVSGVSSVSVELLDLGTDLDRRVDAGLDECDCSCFLAKGPSSISMGVVGSFWDSLLTTSWPHALAMSAPMVRRMVVKTL